MVLRVRPAPTRTPPKIDYNLVENKPLRTITSACVIFLVKPYLKYTFFTFFGWK